MIAFQYKKAKMTKSTSKAAAEAGRRWFVVDAEGKVLGRLASEVAHVLLGKNKPTFTPNADDGDFVIVVNAEKVLLTGGKEQKKEYHHHTGWMGGIKTFTAAKLRERKPEELLRRAVQGMLPKGTLGRNMNSKLKLFVGPDHNLQAQQPTELPLRHLSAK